MTDPGHGRPGGSVDPRAVRARHRFIALVTAPGDRLDVAEASLMIAAEDRPDTDVDGAMARLDDLGARVRCRLDVARARRPRANDDEMAIGALHDVLFVEEGFGGATAEEYARPEASYLDVVLDRRRGLPILLSIIYCAVAARAGLSAVGIGLPGHFVAEFRGSGMRVLVDPFDGGARLSVDEAQVLARRATGQAISLDPWHLQATPARHVVARVLENLRRSYLRAGEARLALEVVERLLIVAPSAAYVRDRGLLLLDVPMPAGANLAAAWFDLRLYARVMADAPDAVAVGHLADRVWRDLGRSN